MYPPYSQRKFAQDTTQWALIELARKQKKQEKLRQELSEFSGSDPTWEQLSVGLPYLDAVVHEVLRLHPPLIETIRVVCCSILCLITFWRFDDIQ
jgi:cytochrome P450